MIKVDLISGFLGAGKTTLIKLLANALTENKERVVIIENEFGEIGIDGKILELEGLKVFEITKGCLCCSVKGDFVETLLKIVQEINPDRILIEPSGIFVPIDIIDIFKDPQINCHMELNALITIIDSIHYLKQRVKYNFFFENQIRYAKSVVMSKTDNISLESISIIRREILKINPSLSLTIKPWGEMSNDEFLQLLSIPTPSTNTSLSEASLFQTPSSQASSSSETPSSKASSSKSSTSKILSQKSSVKNAVPSTTSSDQKGHKNFQSFSVSPQKHFTKDGLQELLLELRNPLYGCILRIKGFVENTDGIIEFNVVDRSIDIKMIGDINVTASVYFIGENLNKVEIEKLFL